MERDTNFGKYKSIKILASGAFGEAHLVECDNSMFVLKVQHCPDEQRRNEAQKEVLALAKIPAHENVLDIEDSFFRGDDFCIVVEFCSGGTVEKFIDNVTPLDEIQRIIYESGKGLSTIHAHSYVHRDIKPDNIFVRGGKAKQIVIGDMGLARKVESGNVYANTFGHSLYMAPESIKKRQCAAGDIWALGCVAFCLISQKTMEMREKEEPDFVAFGLLEQDEIDEQVDTLVEQIPSLEGHVIEKALRQMLMRSLKKRISAEGLVELLAPS